MDSKQKVSSADGFARLFKRTRALTFTIYTIALTCFALLPQVQSFKFFYAVEQAALTLRFHATGKEDIRDDAAPIVIVGIDDDSLNPELSEEDLRRYPNAKAMTGNWPWNRSIHGYLAQRLFDAGASVVVFDFLFLSPNEGDWDFYETIEKNQGRVVLGYDYSPSENELGETKNQERLPYDDLLPLGDLDTLLGFVNIEPDEDGVLRRALLRTNLFAQNQSFIDDPVGFERISRRAKQSETFLSLGALAATLHEPSVKDTIPPIFQSPIINYGGLNLFPYLSYQDIIIDDRFENQKGIVDGAIVFVGPYSDFFKDVISTPVGDMFGVESHAHVARSLLNRSFYHDAQGLWKKSLNITLAILLLIGNLKLQKAFQKALWTLSLIIAFLTTVYLSFASFHTVFPMIPGLIILVGGGITFLTYDFAISQYERSRLRGYLSRYVSPEVAHLLSEESSELELLLKGANRPIAVVFSDIRGFTTLSEQYTPVALVAHLNDYFESMVDGIHQHKGLLNKYIGDAILAIWGGLFSSGPAEDCYNAVRASMEMERRMDELNQQWSTDPERLPLKIGIGISFGDGFVGNMGHPNRMEFAVMGDVVNLGSRLEGATKQYDCGILVSEEVYDQCSDRIRFRKVDVIQVKGKTSGIHTYTPVNLISEPEPEWFNEWESAIEKYRSRDFDAAKAMFVSLGEKRKNLSRNASIYRERCTSLIKEPPPKNWDYVFVMQTK